MSYILEALKKVDRERGIGAVPDLATPLEAKHPASRSYPWLWIVAVLLSLNAALVVMLLKDKDTGDAKVPGSAQVPAERQPALTNQPLAQPALTNPPLVQPAQQTRQARIAEALTPEKPVLPESQPAQPAGELVVLPEPAYLQNSEQSLLPDEKSDTQIELATTAEDPSQLQSWYELPQEIRSKIDLPRLDVHVYSEDPGKRFIMLNLEKFREGERLPSGLIVEEILPDGMVMSYQGERFRVEK